MRGVEWDPEAITHMFERHDVTPLEAEEALNDPEAVVLSPDPASRSGLSDRIIGWSSSRSELLVVILVNFDGRLFGANAWTANEAHIRRYEGDD